MNARKSRRGLSSDDKEVWKQVAKTIAPMRSVDFSTELESTGRCGTCGIDPVYTRGSWEWSAFGSGDYRKRADPSGRRWCDAHTTRNHSPFGAGLAEAAAATR